MELEINESNFHEYFKDLRNHAPERGEVIAQYSAVAEFVDGGEKRQIISLLTSTENKMEATAQVMRKLLFASELDAYKIPRLMAEDILSGMTEEECAAKPYKYTLEMFFYANPENVPKDDPHWSLISVLNLDEFLVKKDDLTGSRILESGDEDYPSEIRQESASGDAAVVQVSEA